MYLAPLPRKLPLILLLMVVIGNILAAMYVSCKTDISKMTPEHIVYAEPRAQIKAKPDVVEESIDKEPSLTDEEIDLIALITMAEAEGESELGKRLVIDTILNRVDSEVGYFPDNVHDVIYQKNAFEPVWNGRMDRCYVMNDIRELVLEEIESRTNYDVVYFTAGKYNEYGTPLFQEGNHYFSGH